MKVQHILSIILSCFEILFGALVVGFPFLVFALQDEGYFSDVCSSDDVTNLTVSESINVSLTTTIVTSVTSQSYPTCNEQEETFAFVYSILIVVLTIGTFTNGFIVSKFGTWISKLIGISFYLSGCLLFATSSNEKSWVLYIATSLLAVGGSFFYLCSVQYANLFPKIKATLIAIFTGTFLSSTIICWLILLAHRSGISFRHSFYFLSGWSVVSFVATFFLSPRKHIPENVDENFKYGIQNIRGKPQTTDEQHTDTENQENGSRNANQSMKQILLSMWKCIKTKYYFTTALYIWILNFRNVFFIATFPTWIKKFGDETELTGYIDGFAIFSLLSGFSSPVIGATADILINRYRKQNMPVELCRLRSFLVCGCIVGVIAMLFTISVAIPVLPLQYFSFFCYMLMRSSIYSYGAICLTGRFPTALYGVLFGSINLFNAVLSLLTKPVLGWVLNDLNGDFLYVEIIFMCLILITFVQPLNLYFSYRSKTKKMAEPSVIENTNAL